MEYVRRSVDSQLDELLEHVAAVSIEGTKGVGKTETARQRARGFVPLDQPSGQELYYANPDLVGIERPVLLDEWQHVPDAWNRVRHLVDDGAAPNSFLITGSATPRSGQGTHSGAGRIVGLRMRPMGVHERGLDVPCVSLDSLFEDDAEVRGETHCAAPDYVREIVASGFPGIRGLPPRIRGAHLSSYLDRIIDRDLEESGYAPRNPEHLRQWMAAYAAATASTATHATLAGAVAADGTQPAKRVTRTYREHLSRIWILDPLPGWIPALNPIARVGQKPKHYLADPSLAARLLGANEKTLMAEHSGYVGMLFEALAVLTLRVQAEAVWARCSHLRTMEGRHEIDMIIESDEGVVLPVEVKFKSAIDDRDVRHLQWFARTYTGRARPGLVVTTGARAYRRRDGIAVVPLALLGP